jgi:hypothetical protein
MVTHVLTQCLLVSALYRLPGAIGVTISFVPLNGQMPCVTTKNRMRVTVASTV